MSNDSTILLVEDDTFLIDILVQKFKSDGYDIIHAGDGETALKKVHENDPDLIFLDIILPGMNGFEVLKKLEDDDTVRDVPVAFLSNLGQKEDIEKGKRLGAVDFIVKANHSLDEIVNKAGEILDSSPMESESTKTEVGESKNEQTASASKTADTKQESQATTKTKSREAPASADTKTADSADTVPEAPTTEQN
jgi:DNA-binding response OmpR family regulator